MAKRPKKSPPTFFQQIRGFFARIFTAPSQIRAEKVKRQLTKQIKAKKYSPSYEKRLLRAVQSGKAKTLQEARGHKPGEAARRREREIAEQNLSSQQIRSIRTFYNRFDPRDRKGVDVDDLISWAQENGYPSFVDYRTQWDKVRKRYLREKANGSYIEQNEDYLDALLDQISAPSREWYFYH